MSEAPSEGALLIETQPEGMTMTRITSKDLKAVVDRINRVTGSPMDAWTRDANGKLRANIGNYHIDSAYSGYGMCRMMNEGGGVTSVLSGFVPARELYEKMHAFLRGFDAAKGGDA